MFISGALVLVAQFRLLCGKTLEKNAKNKKIMLDMVHGVC